MDVLNEFEDVFKEDFKINRPVSSLLNEITTYKIFLKHVQPCGSTRKYFLKLESCEFQRRQVALDVLKLNENALLLEKGSIKIESAVYQSGDQRMLKLYLKNVGQTLQSLGKPKDAMRMLEAAHVIGGENSDINELETCTARLLSKVYKDLGQHRKSFALIQSFGEALERKKAGLRLQICKAIPFSTWQGEEECSAIAWEEDLFGTGSSCAGSCTFLLKDALHADRSFVAGEVLFIDKPVVGHVMDSKWQCNYCTMKTIYTVPCVACCAVFYCSINCQQNDAHFHKYECTGFKLMFFPLLDGVLELRMLVKALDILENNLKKKKYVTYPRTAKKLWKELLVRNEHSGEFCKILSKAFNSMDVEDNVYTILLRKSGTLLEYVLFDQRILRDYKLCLSNLYVQERTLFLGSLLLRISIVTKTMQCKFNYDITYNQNDTSLHKVSTKQNEKANAFIPIESKQIACLWYDCVHASKENNEPGDVIENALGLYCEKYHATFDFVNRLKALTSTATNQYRGMYVFPMKTEYSYQEANIIPILLNHGAVAFRAMRPIRQGEKLKVLYACPKFNMNLAREVDELEDLQVILCNVFGGNNTTPQYIGQTLEAVLVRIDEVMEPYSKAKFDTLLFTVKQTVQIFNFFIFDQPRNMLRNLPDKNSYAMLIHSLSVVERAYKEARLISEVLMQHDWLLDLVDSIFEMGTLKKACRKGLAHILLKS